MTRPTIGLLLTLALSLLVVPLVPETQPPTPVHRIGVLSGTTPGGPSVHTWPRPPLPQRGV
jgi:hypothetical protein